MPGRAKLNVAAALIATYCLCATLPSATGERGVQAPSSPLKTGSANAKFSAVPELTDDGVRLRTALAGLESLANEYIGDKGVPGLAICVVHKGKVVYAKGFGIRLAGSADKVDADTVFQLASVSKPIASTVLASLVSDGKVQWDSRICDLDPAFQMFDPMASRELTIRDLLCHRSGLPEHAGDLLEDLGFSRADILHRLRYQRPASSFRSHYDYTNFGYSEAVFAAGAAAGRPWEELAQTCLFKPLGMDSTSTRFSEFMARRNKASGHILENGKWIHREQRNPDAQSPAGGVSSSANDMARWLMLQLGGGEYGGKQLISKSALDETHHPEIFVQFSPDGLPSFYGLGFNVNYDKAGLLHIGHSGGFCMGAATCISMIPDKNLGICVLTNAAPVGVAEGLTQTFTTTFQYGKPTRDWMDVFKKVFSNPEVVGITKGFDYTQTPATATAALVNAAYIGNYSSDYFGSVQVDEDAGALILKIGPKPLKLCLHHYDRDIFTFNLDTENLAGTTGVRFSIDSNGKAASLLIEGLNVQGQGTFSRQRDI